MYLDINLLSCLQTLANGVNGLTEPQNFGIRQQIITESIFLFNILDSFGYFPDPRFLGAQKNCFVKWYRFFNSFVN